MVLSHRLCGPAILAARLFWLAVSVCLMVAPLWPGCCAGLPCEMRQHAPEAETHCHESIGTPGSSHSVAARATRGCDAMNSPLEAVREEFRVFSSNEARSDIAFSSPLACDFRLPQPVSESPFLRQNSFAPFLDPQSCSVFPLRS